MNHGGKSSKVNQGLHDLRFLPLDRMLLDRTTKAGKPGPNGGTSLSRRSRFTKVLETCSCPSAEAHDIVRLHQRGPIWRSGFSVAERQCRKALLSGHAAAPSVLANGRLLLRFDLPPRPAASGPP